MVKTRQGKTGQQEEDGTPKPAAERAENDTSRNFLPKDQFQAMIEQDPKGRRGHLLDNNHDAPDKVTSLHSSRPKIPQQVSFTRAEMMTILNVYGRMVAAGEWRDYAIDSLKEKAIFSIFRRTNEMPLYRIEKIPKLARKQGAFALLSQQGLILKRGQDLDPIIKLLNQKLLKAI